MAYWCENLVTFRHKDPVMLKRAKDAFNRARLLEEFVPVPVDLSERALSEWCWEAWGTTRDIGLQMVPFHTAVR